MASLLAQDGAGSGLDADLLDGKDSIAFADGTGRSPGLIPQTDGANGFSYVTADADNIAFTPYSTLSATDVQTAIEELLDEGSGLAAADIDTVKELHDIATDRYATNITAFAGGGQASATLLVAQENIVTTVASDADSVKAQALASVSPGQRFIVSNLDSTGSNTLSLYPNTDDAFGDLNDNVAIVIPSGSDVIYWRGDSAAAWNYTLVFGHVEVQDQSGSVYLALDGGRVYHDTNTNGVKDAGEEYIDQQGGTQNPSITAAAIGPDGVTLTLTADQPIDFGSSAAGFDIDGDGLSGSDNAATYSSGRKTASPVFTLASTVETGETVNLDYVNPWFGWQDKSGISLLDFTDLSVTNNSIQDGTAPALTAISVNGASWTFSASESLTQGAGFDAADWTATGSTSGAITLSSFGGDGTATWTATGSPAAAYQETVTFSYAGTADGAEDADGNDLAAIVSAAVTNTTSAGSLLSTLPKSGNIIGLWDVSNVTADGSGNVTLLPDQSPSGIDLAPLGGTAPVNNTLLLPNGSNYAISFAAVDDGLGRMWGSGYDTELANLNLAGASRTLVVLGKWNTSQEGNVGIEFGSIEGSNNKFGAGQNAAGIASSTVGLATTNGAALEGVGYRMVVARWTGSTWQIYVVSAGNVESGSARTDIAPNTIVNSSGDGIAIGAPMSNDAFASFDFVAAAVWDASLLSTEMQEVYDAFAIYITAP